MTDVRPLTLDEEATNYHTFRHIEMVRNLLSGCATELLDRGKRHDQSKLRQPEVTVFADFTPKLANSVYGSDEYKSFLAEMKPALDHHYSKNSHHPEFYPNGVDGMDLFDVIEMLMDWRAASSRHHSGCIHKSIEINTQRFNLSPQLASILRNTAERMWPKAADRVTQ